MTMPPDVPFTIQYTPSAYEWEHRGGPPRCRDHSRNLQREAVHQAPQTQSGGGQRPPPDLRVDRARLPYGQTITPSSVLAAPAPTCTVHTLMPVEIEALVIVAV